MNYRELPYREEPKIITDEAIIGYYLKAIAEVFEDGRKELERCSELVRQMNSRLDTCLSRGAR